LNGGVDDWGIMNGEKGREVKLVAWKIERSS